MISVIKHYQEQLDRTGGDVDLVGYFYKGCIVGQNFTFQVIDDRICCSGVVVHPGDNFPLIALNAEHVCQQPVRPPVNPLVVFFILYKVMNFRKGTHLQELKDLVPGCPVLGHHLLVTQTSGSPARFSAEDPISRRGVCSCKRTCLLKK